MNEASPIRVLVLEDSPQDAFLLRAALEKVPACNCEVLHAERLYDALDVLQRQSIDLVLTDLNLPDSSGLDTVNELVGHARGVPVVVLAGCNPGEVSQQLTKTGAWGCISKERFDCPALSQAVSLARERKLADYRQQQRAS